MKNEGSVGGEGVAEESMRLGDKMEAVGECGLRVNRTVTGDEIERLLSGVGGRSDPAVEGGDEAKGIGEKGAEDGVAV